MSPLTLSRPGTDESAPFYHGYIDKVPGERIGEYLTSQLGEVERLLAPLDDATGRFRYAPEKWSVKEVLGHLCDAERIFAYRLLRIARADTTPLPGFDEDAYVPPAEFDARPLAELLREFQAVRGEHDRAGGGPPVGGLGAARPGERQGHQHPGPRLHHGGPRDAPPGGTARPVSSLLLTRRAGGGLTSSGV